MQCEFSCVFRYYSLFAQKLHGGYKSESLRLPYRASAAGVKRELDVFAKENRMVKALIEHSFLSDILKRRYWLSVDYRQKMLVW